MTSGCPHAAPYLWRALEVFWTPYAQVGIKPTRAESIKALSWSQIIPMNLDLMWITYIEKCGSFYRAVTVQMHLWSAEMVWLLTVIFVILSTVSLLLLVCTEEKLVQSWVLFSCCSEFEFAHEHCARASTEEWEIWIWQTIFSVLFYSSMSFGEPHSWKQEHRNFTHLSIFISVKESKQPSLRNKIYTHSQFANTE